MTDRPPPQRQRPRVVSVSQLTKDMKQAVESVFFNCHVEGEAIGVKTAGRGHTYFTLKDQWAQISCVIWAQTSTRLPFRLADGMRVVAQGDVQLYVKSGRYQLIIHHLAEEGLGAQLLALEQLKRRLHAEGLFDPARKRPLPALPQRIGVATAATGAALRDIVATIARRFPRPILVAPCRVQGNDAVSTIISALGDLVSSPGVDVIIVGRGGGGAQDLAAFNDERVVRAIAASPIPVISAVGHEVDMVLSDLVADVRAATPTAAAELVVPDRRPLQRRVGVAQDRLIRSARRAVAERQQRLDELLIGAGHAFRQHTEARARRLAALKGRLANLHPKTRVAQERQRLVGLTRRLAAAGTRETERRNRRLNTLVRTLGALSPEGNLERGYAIIRIGHERRVLTDPSGVSVGDPLEVMLHAGKLWATVTDVQGSEQESG